jgi:long-subunit acyl-CoA synthetase (AMP-forming)
MLINRPDFHLCDAAAMHLGATCFSVYNTSAPEQIEYVTGDARNRAIFTEEAFVDRVLEVRDGGRTAIEHVVLVDGERDGCLTLAELERRGEHADGFDFDAAWQAVAPEDVLCLIYTSGTTGPPKGVQLTHANMMAELRALDPVLHTHVGGRAVSYLPAAHIADRWASHYSPMSLGTQVTCCPDPRELFVHIADAKPTHFGGVPRIWEKLKAALEAGIDSEADQSRQEASRWAIETGLRKVRLEQAGEPVPPELEQDYRRADELVFSAIRERLGFSETEYCVAGAAPTPVEVLEFFTAIGIPILELWGMSETSCVFTLNPPGRIKIGTVGPPLPGQELKLADDGEILVRGPLIMTGYRNMPEKTAEALDPDGWLHTGDIGEIDEDGYLRIVDRKKELIINAAGKNMSPANIEARLKTSSPLIGQAIAIGDRRPYNVALLTLDPEAIVPFAAEHGIEGATAAALADHPAVVEEVRRGVEEANSHLSRVEQIKRFKVLGGDWEPGGDELTPTMKLKRKPIAEKYAAEIEALYS